MAEFQFAKEGTLFWLKLDQSVSGQQQAEGDQQHDQAKSWGRMGQAKLGRDSTRAAVDSLTDSAL